ncbi:MAG: phosphoglucosamine mutase [Candidatus Riflemargulisbacteria bacterium]
MTETSLKITVAGIRGENNLSLLPSTALKFAEIFGTIMNKGTIVLGTDTRLSTLPFKSAVIAGLSATGCNVIDIGIVATPTSQIMVKKLKAQGGIMITASHNPIQWNGLKFISDKGIFFDEEQMQEIFDLYDQYNETLKSSSTNEAFVNKNIINYADIRSLGQITSYSSAAEEHINHLLKNIDVESIKKSGLKVVVDSCNGSGAVLNPILFKKLGIEMININSAPDGNFTRGPEPLPENITLLREKVLETKSDIGFAQDADADRLAIVNEKGQAIGEDYTLVLVMKYILQRHPNPAGKIVATNLSTSKAFDDVAELYKTKVVTTKIGEVNVSKVLLQKDAIVGGEGNGGVIIPEIGLGRDSFAGIAFMLEYMAKTKMKVSELVNTVPRYEVVKTSKHLSSQEEVKGMLDKVKSTFAGEKMDLQDGVKVIFDDSWIHVRASNTEPIVRYFAEAKSKDIAQSLINKVF